MNWAKKKVLITGGAGFIGSCIAEKLLEKGAEIIIMDNFAVGRMENVPSGTSELIRGDVCDWDLLGKIDDIDYIFHFGAPSSNFLFRQDPKFCLINTIHGFMNILELSKAIGVKEVVYASSNTVYGNAPSPQSEDVVPQPQTTYAISKLTCEHLAKFYSGDVASVGMRIFSGYGPKEKHKGKFASPVTQFLSSIIKEENPIVFGDGRQSRDFVYIDDIVNAAIKATEISFQGIINVGSGYALAFNEVIRIINSFLSKNVKPNYLEHPSNYRQKTLADTRRLKELLQITPVDFEEGLRRYLSTDQELTDRSE